MTRKRGAKQHEVEVAHCTVVLHLLNGFQRYHAIARLYAMCLVVY